MDKLNNIKLLILLFYSFSCKIINLTSHNIDNKETNITLKESTSLNVSFDRNLVNSSNYLNIQMKNKNKNYLGQLAFYSRYDYNCMQGREQMIINPYGDSFMVLHKSKLINFYNEYDKEYDKKYEKDNKNDKYDNFYICIYCLMKTFCDYNRIK